MDALGFGVGVGLGALLQLMLATQSARKTADWRIIPRAHFKHYSSGMASTWGGKV